MGKIVVTLNLTNDVDEMLAERGFIPSDGIRRCTLDNVLVDTGATRLCLPADIIAKLGLKSVGTIEAKTAMGTQSVNVYDRVRLNVEGKEGSYKCVELPVGQTPLLGLIPLEDLGLDPDLKKQRLKHLPTTDKETYLTIL
ncbi:MAG: aspartyl protease [Phormidesmis priestleyi]|uniref:Aspartyl protease n=1 Tax=Phormidesmis priestleyi TaxID=268141 RepID=A0A2W4ZK32_9CYAN|nr:MAG: aspartyl protease [Phormidesmis priestleyi]